MSKRLDAKYGAPRFAVGQKVYYQPWGTTAEVWTVVVGNQGEKNDQRVYDLHCGNWAYEDQLSAR